MKKQVPISEYSKDAFLTNPAASANEWTGYVPTGVQTEGEAEAEELLMNAPVTAPLTERKR